MKNINENLFTEFPLEQAKDIVSIVAREFEKDKALHKAMIENVGAIKRDKDKMVYSRVSRTYDAQKREGYELVIMTNPNNQFFHTSHTLKVWYEHGSDSICLTFAEGELEESYLQAASALENLATFLEKEK